MKTLSIEYLGYELEIDSDHPAWQLQAVTRLSDMKDLDPDKFFSELTSIDTDNIVQLINEELKQ